MYGVGLGMDDEKPDVTWKVEIAGFGGPIAEQGFDENGNYYTIFENGAESWISAEVIADAMDSPEPPTPTNPS